MRGGKIVVDSFSQSVTRSTTVGSLSRPKTGINVPVSANVTETDNNYGVTSTQIADSSKHEQILIIFWRQYSKSSIPCLYPLASRPQLKLLH